MPTAPLSANSVYAGISSAVNANVCSPSVSSPAPLLASLPVDQEQLIVFLRGVVSALGKPRKWGDSLVAMLRFRGRHSNRVWAGVPTTAEEAEVSPTTIKRVRRWLREQLGVETLTGDDLHSGPGPHNFTGQRRGSRQTSTLDYSSLARLVPLDLLNDLRAAVLGRARRAAAPAVQNPADAADQAITDAIMLADPFSDTPPAAPAATTTDETITASVLGVRGEALSDSGSGTDTFPTQPKAAAAPPCNVSIESVGNDAGAAVAVAPQKKRNAPTVGREPFQGPKLAYKAEQQPGYMALRALGMWAAVCKQIVMRRGDAWAYKLARYATWAKGVTDKAAFARRTEAAFEGWPDWLDERMDREQAAAQRAVAIEQKTIATRRSAPSSAPPKAPTMTIDGLPEPERANLLTRALAEVLSSSPPPVRRAIERKGVKHGLVVSRAVALLAEKKVAD